MAGINLGDSIVGAPQPSAEAPVTSVPRRHRRGARPNPLDRVLPFLAASRPMPATRYVPWTEQETDETVRAMVTGSRGGTIKAP